MLRKIVTRKARPFGKNGRVGSYTLKLECGHLVDRKSSDVKPGRKKVQCRECDREFDRWLAIPQDDRTRDNASDATGRDWRKLVPEKPVHERRPYHGSAAEGNC